MTNRWHTENLKMRIENRGSRLVVWCFGLGLMCLFLGCPQDQVVEVKVVPVGGATEAPVAVEKAETTEAKGYGTLYGTVTLDGTFKELPMLVAKGDPSLKQEDRAVCAVSDIPDESLVVNSANKGLANVVIFLEKRPANIKPELSKPPTEPVLFDQKGCRFLPHVLVVQAGQPLMILNDDALTHNTHTNPKRNTGFNQSIPPHERTGIACDYKKPESGPISVVCDVHRWMKAFHFPIDHPYWAVTDKDGKYRIEGLPAGKHSFNVWQERGPGDSHLLVRKLDVVIDVDQETPKDLNFGPDKFARLPRASRRAVAYERLLNGGEIVVTQTEDR